MTIATLLGCLALGYLLGRTRPYRWLDDWSSFRVRGFGWRRTPTRRSMLLVALICLALHPIRLRRAALQLFTGGRYKPPAKPLAAPVRITTPAERVAFQAELTPDQVDQVVEVVERVADEGRRP